MDAVIYARISKAADTAGVDRQVAECRTEAERLGWTVVGEYVDNDVSAYSGRRRPAYEQMLDSDFDALLVWSADRLYRRVTDLERLVDALGGRQVVALRSGDIDLSTADGRMIARLLGSVAQRESEKMAERIVASKKQTAENGGILGGPRPFGWEPDRKALRATEAGFLAEVYEGVATGDSITRWVREAARRGVRSSTGKTLSHQALRTSLLRPGNAGITSYKGQVLGRQEGPSVIDEVTFRTVQRILTDPSRPTVKGPRARTLLSGVGRCGACGGRIKGGGAGTYRCVNLCLSATRRRLDAEVSADVVAYLESHREVLEAAASEQADDIGERAEAETLRRRLDDLAALAAEGELDPADFAGAARRLRAGLEHVETRIATRGTNTLGNLREAWDGANVEDQRRILGELVTCVLFIKGRQGVRAKYAIEWKTATTSRE